MHYLAVSNCTVKHLLCDIYTGVCYLRCMDGDVLCDIYSCVQFELWLTMSRLRSRWAAGKRSGDEEEEERRSGGGGDNQNRLGSVRLNGDDRLKRGGGQPELGSIPAPPSGLSVTVGSPLGDTRLG